MCEASGEPLVRDGGASSNQPGRPLEGATREQDRVQQYYDAYWQPETTRYRHTPPSRAGLPIPSKVRRLLESSISPEALCLDVGCGPGSAAGVTLTEHGCRYLGVDVSERAVEQARARGLDARKIEDASALPFPDAAFDAAVCLEVLEHLMYPQLAVSEMFRVLRPGGTLVVTTPNVAYWRRRIDLLLLGRWNPFGYSLAVEQPWADPHIRFFNPGSLRRLLRASGFTNVRISGHEGTLLGDLPWVGRRFLSSQGSPVYGAIEGLMPSVFGCFLNGVAVKPAEGKG